MTAHQDEQDRDRAHDAAPDQDPPAQEPRTSKDRFREALEAKRAAQHSRGSGVSGRDQLAGHAKDGAHGHKVFRRKSG